MEHAEKGQAARFWEVVCPVFFRWSLLALMRLSSITCTLTVVPFQSNIPIVTLTLYSTSMYQPRKLRQWHYSADDIVRRPDEKIETHIDHVKRICPCRIDLIEDVSFGPIDQKLSIWPLTDPTFDTAWADASVGIKILPNATTGWKFLHINWFRPDFDHEHYAWRNSQWTISVTWC